MKPKPHLLMQTIIFENYKDFYTHEEKQVIRASFHKDIDDRFNNLTSLDQ